MKRILAGLAATVILVTGWVWNAAPAQASPDAGCETIHWGLFGSQLRTICDGPLRPDGSWLRGRRVWVSAGYVPGYTYCGTWSCSSTGGYYRQEGTVALETYVVFPSNVLPDEPGWLPPGTMVIR